MLQALIFIHSCKVRVLLQLLLLNEAAVVLVNDGEGLLHIIGALAGQAARLEELLVVEGVGSWNAHKRHDNVRLFSWHACLSMWLQCGDGRCLVLFTPKVTAWKWNINEVEDMAWFQSIYDCTWRKIRRLTWAAIQSCFHISFDEDTSEGHFFISWEGENTRHTVRMSITNPGRRIIEKSTRRTDFLIFFSLWPEIG